MAKRYLNANDVRMKLNRSVALYKKKPCYITTENDEQWDEVTITFLADRRARPLKIKHYDDDLDTKALELGYMNYYGNAHFVHRLPERVQNQAMRQNSLIVTPNPGGGWFTSEPFKKMLLGEYPPYEQALNNVKEGYSQSEAISRYYCLGKIDKRKIGLYLRSNLVAFINNDAPVFITGSDSSFIIQDFETVRSA